jgi:hypothetical protein
LAKFAISCAYVRPVGLAAEAPLTRKPEGLMSTRVNACGSNVAAPVP